MIFENFGLSYYCSFIMYLRKYEPYTLDTPYYRKFTVHVINANSKIRVNFRYLKVTSHLRRCPPGKKSYARQFQ